MEIDGDRWRCVAATADAAVVSLAAVLCRLHTVGVGGVAIPRAQAVGTVR